MGSSSDAKKIRRSAVRYWARWRDLARAKWAAPKIAKTKGGRLARQAPGEILQTAAKLKLPLFTSARFRCRADLTLRLGLPFIFVSVVLQELRREFGDHPGPMPLQAIMFSAHKAA